MIADAIRVEETVQLSVYFRAAELDPPAELATQTNRGLTNVSGQDQPRRTIVKMAIGLAAFASVGLGIFAIKFKLDPARQPFPLLYTLLNRAQLPIRTMLQ